jgi:hypothetical protein
MANPGLYIRYCIRLLPILVFILFSHSTLHAQITRFVAVTGDDLGGANACADSNSPCRTIAHAISVSSSGDLIDIAAGVYTESVVINKSLTLTGAGQGITIIQAHTEPFTALARVINISPGLEVAISGVTVRHGRTAVVVSLGGGIYNNGSVLNLTDVTISHNSSSIGGGMTTAHNSVATLNNVRFNDNVSSHGGGGIHIMEGSNATLTGVEFTGNSTGAAGGGIHVDMISRLTLVNGTLNDNTADNFGGAIYIASTDTSRLYNVVFSGNSSPEGSGGALYNDESHPVLINAVFTGNTAEMGGAVFNDASSPTIVNALFSGNIAEFFGGGMRNGSDSNPLIINATFSGNYAVEGGGMANGAAGPVIVNSIFWGNGSNFGAPSGSIFNDGLPGPSISFSVVEGYNYSGEQNLDGTDDANDPLFLDAPDPIDAPTQAGDLRLQAGSPAIDRGDPDTDPSLFLFDGDAPLLDLAGNDRFVNGRIDLGAYEYAVPTSVEDIAGLPVSVELYQNYPNPFNPSTTIRYSLPDRMNVKLSIFDTLGREIGILVNAEQGAGDYEVRFDAADLASGVYVVRLETGALTRMNRMLFVR